MTTLLRCIRAAAALCLLGGCASMTYEAEEWRVAVPPGGEAHAVVRYIGLGAAAKDAASRTKMIEKIHKLAAAESPGSSYAPVLCNPQRKVYLEGSKLVLEESGSIRNPFTWFEQTGLNPAGWFSGSLKLSQKGDFVVKRGLEGNQQVIATDGRLVDEDTYTTILKGVVPFDLKGDTKWQRHEDQPNEEDVRSENLTLIMWPRAARTFYWKLSGRAFGKQWQALGDEYGKAYPAITRLKATEPEAASDTPPAKTMSPIEQLRAAAEKETLQQKAATNAPPAEAAPAQTNAPPAAAAPAQTNAPPAAAAPADDDTIK